MTEEPPAQRVHTILLPVKAGTAWRVQIVWPNGSVHYFGTFASERGAADWIKSHAWLTVGAAASPLRQDRKNE
jgi:hypothetical protein